MGAVVDWLKGKKTYITAIAGALAAVGGWLGGEMSIVGMFQSVWAALSVVFIRLGVTKSGSDTSSNVPPTDLA